MRPLFLFALLLASLPALRAQDRHVVLICLDGFAARHLDDPAIELPNLRALAAKGARAASSETVYPSVTHPAHTTLITGVTPREHGVLANTMTNRETGAVFHANTPPRSQTVLVPTLFDAAKRKGLKTAALHWPQLTDDPAVDFNFASRYLPGDRLDPAAIKPELRAELVAAGVPVDAYFRWRAEGTLREAVDTVLVDAASHFIRRHRPHFLAIHISNSDSKQHAHGPDSALGHAALNLADRHVGLLVKAVAQAGLAERTLFAITADHGFATVRHEANLHPLFAEAGLADKVALFPHGWSMFVRRLPAFAAADQPKLDAVLARIKAIPEIGRVLRSAEYPSIGYPTFEENVHVQGEFLVIGNIAHYLAADPRGGEAVVRPRAQPAHSHGFLPGHPLMHAMLVFAGAGVKSGATFGHVSNLDVAPTIARFLGLELPGARGRVLTEALAEPAETAAAR